ncbi:uncharacterized protein [Oscarella lobularis]
MRTPVTMSKRRRNRPVFTFHIFHLPLPRRATMDPKRDYAFKLILLGDVCSGKTSLCHRFLSNDAAFTLPNEATIGVDFGSRTINLDGETIILRIFDTTGQKSVMSRLRPLYRGAHGIIIVYNVTRQDTFDGVKRWLQEVDRYAEKGVSKMIIGSQCDLMSPRVVPYTTAKEYADQLGIPFLETSAKDGKNVEQAFMTMAAEIMYRVGPVTRMKALMWRRSLAEAEERCSQQAERLKVVESQTKSLEEEKRNFEEKKRNLRHLLGQSEQKCLQLSQRVDHLTEIVKEKDAKIARLQEFENFINILPEDVHLTGVRLGKGAYGKVDIGHWRGSPVAVKTFHESIKSEHYCALFRQEMEICSRIRHPNIVAICGVIIMDDTPFQIITNLLEGSLCDVIKASLSSKSLTLKEKVDLSLGFVAGICYLHQLRPTPVLHGDIRSTNILVTATMVAQVGDLGSARFSDASLSAGIHSVEYIAPERLDGSQARNTAQADVCSLGVTLGELMTCREPIKAER